MSNLRKPELSSELDAALCQQASEDERVFDVLTRLTHMLGSMLGASTEVVLHDLRKPGQSVVAITNGQVTGRKVGEPLDALGVHLFEQHNFQDIANYQTRTKNGKTLRSCSVFVKDEAGDPIGAVCVNQDMTALLSMQHWLDQTLRTEAPKAPADSSENNVEDVLSGLIEEAIRSTGKRPENFTREDKTAVISYLNTRGAFLIRYSMEKVAALLGISKFSIYNYLGELRDAQEVTSGA